MARNGWKDMWELEKEFGTFNETVFRNNQNIYDCFTDEQLAMLENSMSQDVTFKYKSLFNNDRLMLSEKKAKALVELTGLDTAWYFGGVGDLGYMLGSCALGHALRYAYYAVTPHGSGRLFGSVNGNLFLVSDKLKKGCDVVIFGETCASDFFNISKRALNELKKTREDSMYNSKWISFIMQKGYCADYMKAFFPDVVNNSIPEDELKYLKNVGVDVVEWSKLTNIGLPLLKSMFISLAKWRKQYKIKVAEDLRKAEVAKNMAEYRETHKDEIEAKEAKEKAHNDMMLQIGGMTDSDMVAKLHCDSFATPATTILMARYNELGVYDFVSLSENNEIIRIGMFDCRNSSEEMKQSISKGLKVCYFARDFKATFGSEGYCEIAPIARDEYLAKTGAKTWLKFTQLMEFYNISDYDIELFKECADRFDGVRASNALATMFYTYRAVSKK